MPSSEDCATLQAYLTGVDQAAREAEAKWGFDRLPLLVDDELRAKFNRQRSRWSKAMETAWESPMLTRDQLDTAIASSQALKRAWAALDVAATAAGKVPVSPEVWETPLHDGTVAAIVRDAADASKVVTEGRHLAVYTLSEVANIIAALPAAICQAKVEFPGAKVLPPRSDGSWVRDGDEIPF